jgi:hypothetical protein
LARGLLEDDGEWRRCLDEGKELQTGYVLRNLLLIILRECSPAQPLALWQEYKSYLCDDLPRTLSRLGFPNASPDHVHDYGLYLMQQTLLWETNKAMKDIGMIPPKHDWDVLLCNPLLQDQLRFDPAKELELLLQNLPSLNEQQRDAFNIILESILTDDKRAFFVVGAAGAGKTFLYNTLCHASRSRELVIVCVAYSGIAAQLLPGGRTAHSTFKIPFDVFDDLTCAIPKSSALAQYLKTADLLIWDECSAQHRYAFEAVDRTLKDIRDDSTSFGGITTVLGGDFLQTLPVLKNQGRSQVVHACLQSSPLWRVIEPNVLKLEKNMRVGDSDEDQQFATWLRQMAGGDLNNANKVLVLPPQIFSPHDKLPDLIHHVYPNIDIFHPPSYFQERCILSPRNADSHTINDSVLEEFPGDPHDLWANDQALDPASHMQDNFDIPPETLHSITPSGFPLAQLTLKIGCPVMILRNLQPREGVCNGSRGIVLSISTRVLKVELFSGQTILVPRIKLVSADPDRPFLLRRLQFPVALSFAMTINKSQGQTFEVVGVDLRHPVFSHGQLYMALSCARHFHSLKCITNESDVSDKTKNVVFREVVI